MLLRGLLEGASRGLALATTNGSYSLDNSALLPSAVEGLAACGGITNGLKHGASCSALCSQSKRNLIK